MPARLDIRIHEKDRGHRAVIARMRSLSGKYLSVGVFGTKANQIEPGRRGRPPSGMTVGEVAAAMEFFPPKNVPRRPFLSRAFERWRQKYIWGLRMIGIEVLDGRSTAREALAKLGAQMVADVRAEIDSGIPPENAPRTALDKGSDTPLRDTDTLYDAIDHRITATRPK